MQDDNLPGLQVFTISEEADHYTIHPNTIIDRQPQIIVRGMAKANADLDDTLDLIAKEVETALAPGVTIGSMVIVLVYRGCTIELLGDAEKPVGVIDMRFETRISNVANAPDVFV